MFGILVQSQNNPEELNMTWLVSGCILALLGSFLFGFYWTNESIPNPERKYNAIKRSLFWVVTVAGTIFLSRWGVKTIGPTHGVFWLIGAILGMMKARSRLVKIYSAEAALLLEPDRNEIKSLVERNLFTKGREATEKLVRKRIDSIKQARSKLLRASLTELHDFIHETRDNAVDFMWEYERICQESLLENPSIDEFNNKLIEALEKYLERILHCIVQLFESLVGPDHRIWVAVRKLEESDEDCSRLYRTILRVGKIPSEERQRQSQNIPESAGLPNYLRKEYEKGKGRGIIILPVEKRSNSNWVITPNDERHEDMSLMAGPIMIKSREAENAGTLREMYMILYINSTEHSAFNDGHKFYMRYCTDALSLFFSMLYRMRMLTGFRLI